MFYVLFFTEDVIIIVESFQHIMMFLQQLVTSWISVALLVDEMLAHFSVLLVFCYSGEHRTVRVTEKTTWSPPELLRWKDEGTDGGTDGRIWTGQTFRAKRLIWIQTLVHQVIKSCFCL